jgi:hypothetical protein
MKDTCNILGCFVSITQAYPNAGQFEKNQTEEQGRVFRSYVWGEKGICDVWKKLNHKDYGVDLLLVLFQFYVNPFPFEVESLKKIESYRAKEKSIGIPIIINDENFFSKSEKDRYEFLKESILQKLDLLAEVIKKKKLDTNIELLKSDVQKVLREWKT